jgi:phage baseplate assembly protein W
MAEFLGVGWGFPVQLNKSQERFSVAEYEESVRQAIWIILSTSPGERVMRSDFGCAIHELVFAPNNATTRGMAERYVSEALLNWEPRIEVLSVRAEAAGERDEELLINIDYQVAMTDSRFNLVYPFYLDRGTPR